MFRNIISKNAFPLAIVSLAAGFLCGSASPALAAATLGDVFCNIYVNAKPFGKVFEWVAYTAGCVFALASVHHLRMNAEDSRSNPMTRGIMYAFGAAGLLSLPAVASTLVVSIFTSTSSGGMTSCSPGGTGSTADGLSGMVTNFVSNIKDPLILVTSLVAILCGLFMIVHGLMKASKHGLDPRSNSVHSILVNLGFGALLISIGDNLKMMLASVFGSSDIASDSVISWSNVAGGSLSGDGKKAVVAALTFVQIIGGIAFVRGWLMLKKAAEGGNVSMAAALTHILGGVLAINIFQFLLIMDKTFGTNFLQ